MDELDLEQKAQIVELSEANMMRTLYDSASSEDASQYGISFQELWGATAFFLDALPSHTFFNRVLGLGIREPVTEAMLDELMALYTSHNSVMCIPASPAAQPTQLTDWLLERGFQPSFNMAKMFRGTDPPPEIKTDLHIERVDDNTAVHAGNIIQVVFHDAYNWPKWAAPWFTNWVQHSDVSGYLAYDGDMPVGACVLVASEEWGSLGGGATLPEYRQRGAQGAIMAQRIRDGIEFGCRWLTTETPEDTPEWHNPSYHNMVRTGFQLAYLQPWYVYKPENQE